MNRALILPCLLGTLMLALVFQGLVRLPMAPLAAYGAGMVLYWLLMAWMIHRHRAWHWLRLRRPPPLILLFLTVAVMAVWWAEGDRLVGLTVGQLALVVAAAAINGSLEEGFWRGALLDRPPLDARAVLLAGGLFTLWHIAPAMDMDRLHVTAGPLVFVALAGMWAVPMLAARLGSGSAGAGAVAHVLMNIALFGALAADNWPQG